MDRLFALMKWLKPRFATLFWFTLAILFLIESWIWDHVKEWLRGLERALGLERLEPWLENLVARLSPQMTLALFAVPMIGALPIKIAAVALLAQGHAVSGVVFIFLAKSLTLGVEAFLFDICRDKLLQMQWFRRLYSIVLDVRAWAAAMVRPWRARALAIWRDARDQALSWMSREGAGFMRRVARLREAIRNRSRA